MTAIEIFFQMMEDYDQLQKDCQPIYEKYPDKVPTQPRPPKEDGYYTFREAHEYAIAHGYSEEMMLELQPIVEAWRESHLRLFHLLENKDGKYDE